LQPDGEDKQGEPGFLHEIECGSVHQLAKVTGEYARENTPVATNPTSRPLTQPSAMPAMRTSAKMPMGTGHRPWAVELAGLVHARLKQVRLL